MTGAELGLAIEPIGQINDFTQIVGHNAAHDSF
jgi:hypothetical protein